MVQPETEEFDWNPFIGRAPAYLCLHIADLGKQTVLERADSLMGLGLPRREAAVVLGSSDESLRVAAHRRAKQGGSKTEGGKA
ncbi:MAG: hypothetical protein ACT4PO_01245 [Actinomycetota bacterium]